MGGFTGAAPTPTLDGVRHLVATGQLRFFLLGGPSTGAGHTAATWVRAHCSRAGFQPAQLYFCSRATAGGADQHA
jgi:hypothetical protein